MVTVPYSIWENFNKMVLEKNLQLFYQKFNVKFGYENSMQH